MPFMLFCQIEALSCPTFTLRELLKETSFFKRKGKKPIDSQRNYMLRCMWGLNENIGQEILVVM